MTKCKFRIAAFLGTFLLSFAMVALLNIQTSKEVCFIESVDYGERITKVLKLEDQIRRSDLKTSGSRKPSGKSSIYDVFLVKIEKTEQIDVSDFPSDFKGAWFRYLDARRNSTEYSNRRKTSKNHDEIFSQFFWDERSLAIEELVKVSKKYGAQLPGE